jgi:hypothetical protein
LIADEVGGDLSNDYPYIEKNTNFGPGGRLVVEMGRDFVSALQPGGFLYYPRMKANMTE